MPVDHREKKFEEAIENYLLTQGGYAKADPRNVDRERALDPTLLIPFIQETQPEAWESLEKFHGAEADTVLPDDLCKAMDSQGSLNVIRHGFKCFGKLFRVAYFAPAHSMNPDTQRLYAANRLTVTRQLHYSTANENSLDLVLSINGIPVERRACQAPIHDRSGPAGEDLPVQEADAGPFRRRSGPGLHDHSAERPIDGLPALQPGRRDRRRQP